MKAQDIVSSVISRFGTTNVFCEQWVTLTAQIADISADSSGHGIFRKLALPLRQFVFISYVVRSSLLVFSNQTGSVDMVCYMNDFLVIACTRDGCAFLIEKFVKFVPSLAYFWPQTKEGASPLFHVFWK